MNLVILGGIKYLCFCPSPRTCGSLFYTAMTQNIGAKNIAAEKGLLQIHNTSIPEGQFGTTMCGDSFSRVIIILMQGLPNSLKKIHLYMLIGAIEMNLVVLALCFIPLFNLVFFNFKLVIIIIIIIIKNAHSLILR